MNEWKPTKTQLTRWGTETYIQGIKLLTRVRDGELEGEILKVFRKRARRLLAFHDGLSEKRISRIKSWLGAGMYRTTEDALKAMKTRKGRR